MRPMVTRPSAILSFACPTLSAIAFCQGHIAKFIDRLYLSAYRALLHIPICEAGRLLPYFFHKRVRPDGKDSVLRSTRQTLVERFHRIFPKLKRLIRINR